MIMARACIRELEATFHKTESVEDHQLDCIRMAQIMLSGLMNGTIDNLSNSQRIMCFCNNPQMSNGLDGFIVKSIDYGHILGFLFEVQRSCGR